MKATSPETLTVRVSRLSDDVKASYRFSTNFGAALVLQPYGPRRESTHRIHFTVLLPCCHSLGEKGRSDENTVYCGNSTCNGFGKAFPGVTSSDLNSVKLDTLVRSLERFAATCVDPVLASLGVALLLERIEDFLTLPTWAREEAKETRLLKVRRR